MADSQDKLPAAESQQEATWFGQTRADATATAKSSDELADEDLDAVAGGKVFRSGLIIPL